MFKKRTYILFILIFFASLFPFQASANGPPPPSSILCEIKNKPENAAYVDLLIQIGKSDREYTAYEADNGQRLGFSEQSPIVLYNQDGFASFTFHFAGADAGNRESSYGGLWFAREGNQYSILEEKYNIIKVALVDKDGNILQISDSVDINPPDRTGFFTGSITYDAAENIVDMSYYDSPFGKIFGHLAMAFSIAFMTLRVLVRASISSGIETLLAALFKIPSEGKVFGVNMATQVFLNIFMLVCGLPYFWCLLIGEAIVYLSEFFIFKRIYKNISVRRLAIFVVVANTVSLIAGMWINYF